MSSSGFLLSLDIDRCACRRVPALIFCGLLLALIGVSLSGLAWPLRSGAAVLVLAGALRELQRAWPGSPRYVTRIRVATDGRFFLASPREPQTLVPVTVTHWWLLPGWAIGLAFVGEDGRRAEALLFRDRLGPDVWRRLRVRLRHGSGQPPAFNRRALT